MLLSRKLPLSAIALTIVSIIGASTAGIMIGSEGLERAELRALGATADGRRNQIQTYLEKIKTDLIITSKRPDVVEALTSFDDAWQYIEGNVTRSLQARYIHNNPHPTGKKQLLVDAEKDAYDAVHRAYHVSLREVQERNGYYDVFLINPKGDVVYTVFKELDYATNLNTGKWSKTDLANIFRDVIKGGSGSRVYFRDFRGYGPSYNAPASFIAKAIENEGEVVGVLVYQMPLDNIKAILHNRTGLGETGETLLVNRSGLLLVDSIMTKKDDALKVRLESDRLGAVSDKAIVTGELADYRNMTSVSAFAGVNFEGANWVITALIDKDEALAGITSMQTWIAVVGLVLVALALMVSIWFARTITRPIDEIVMRMKQLTSGDTNFDCSDIDSSDEIGQMAQSLAVFKQASLDKESLEQEAKEKQKVVEEERRKAEQAAALAFDSIGDALGKLAGGDLTARVTTELSDQYDELKKNFNTSAATLEAAFDAVAGGANNIYSGTNEIAQASDDLSRRTENQAATLEETAASVAEVTNNIAQSAAGADRARQFVAQSKQAAENGGEVVQRAVKAMEGIERSSDEIGDIIGVIDEIAFQTNLLALNAGVEAARAGDAGRGFAVVASEVRALAQRSAKAAREIKELISSSTKQVDHGVKLVRETGGSLQEILEGVSEINTLVTEIATSAQEQATSLQQVNTAVSQLDQVTQENAAMVEQATAATRTLATQTQQLQAQVSRFQTGGPSGAIRSTVNPHEVGHIANSAVIDQMQIKSMAKTAVANGIAVNAPSAATTIYSNSASGEGWEEF